MIRLSQIFSILTLIAIAVILKLTQLSGYSGGWDFFRIYFTGTIIATALFLVYSFLYERKNLFWFGFLSFLANIGVFLASLLMVYIATRIRQPNLLIYSIAIGFALTSILNIFAFKGSIRRSWGR